MSTGKDLNILITCNYLPHHHWMVFASWYSIYKNLPDAKVKVFCDKSICSIEQELFAWTKKLCVDFSYKKGMFDLEIPCDTMAIRDWISPIIYDVKSSDIATFCTYRNGCGNFVVDEWINSIVPPFSDTDSFKKEGMMVNEFKILELWRRRCRFMWRWSETMRNFEYNEDDDYKNEIDKFWQGEDDDSDDDDMEDAMYESKEIIHALEIQLAEKDLDLRILKTAIKTLESSFWWKFYNFRTRLKMIARTYLVLFKLLEKTRENEERNAIL